MRNVAMDDNAARHASCSDEHFISDILDELIVALVGLPAAFALQQMASNLMSSNSTPEIRIQVVTHLVPATVFLILYYFYYSVALHCQFRPPMVGNWFGVALAFFGLFMAAGGLIAMGAWYTPSEPGLALNATIVAMLGLGLAYLHVSFYWPEFEEQLCNFRWFFYFLWALLLFVLTATSSWRTPAGVAKVLAFLDPVREFLLR